MRCFVLFLAGLLLVGCNNKPADNSDSTKSQEVQALSAVQKNLKIEDVRYDLSDRDATVKWKTVNGTQTGAVIFEPKNTWNHRVELRLVTEGEQSAHFENLEPDTVYSVMIAVENGGDMVYSNISFRTFPKESE